MNLLSVEQLSKSFGDKTLFKKINFGINHGDKHALVAKNGAGKTTLIQILKGKEIADEGKVIFRKDIKVAFLDQEPQFPGGKTVMDVISMNNSDIAKVVHTYNEWSERCKTDYSEAALNAFDKATQDMNDWNAWDYEAKMKEILHRLAITRHDQVVDTLSGGQRKRLALAEILIQQPDLLILDEPTNHLDLEMIEWLENYLLNADITVLLITHDRYVLDEVCNGIWELDGGDIYFYKGNFSYYLEKKAERLATLDAEIDKAKNTYRKELEWMRRMPKARGTKAKSRITAFYEVEQKAKMRRQEQKIEMDVKMTRLGSKILELIKVSKAYEQGPLFQNFNYVFKSGEKIGIIGKNGSGKSTLLNIIMGNIQPDSGKITAGETVVFGYYSQQGMQLKEDKRVLEVIKDYGEFIPLANGSTLSASQLLTRFAFPPEMQYSFVSKLSGGEKRRLYLLTVLIKNPNFLILDEPTNDLDILTLQTLEEFLAEFKGCVLVVSHDRYFMDRLVEHVFALEGDGEIKDFPGNYTEYRIWKMEQEELKKEKEKEEKTSQKNNPTPTQSISKSSGKLSYKEKLELEKLETDISSLETSKKEKELKLAEIQEHLELEKIANEIAELIQQIEEKTFRWVELSEKEQ